MSTNVQIFSNPEFGNVRTLEINNTPYFVGIDIAACLGYAKPRNAISQHVDNEDALKWGVPDNQGFTQETFIINESGVYSLIFGSKLEKAKQFKNWVTREVLPSIRKTGGYSIAEKLSRKDIAMMLLESEEEKERLQQEKAILEEQNRLNVKQIELAVPKVQYYEEVLQSPRTYTSTQVAKEIGMREAEQLHKYLKSRGIMFRQSGQWMLTAKYSQFGYTSPRTHPFFNHKTGLHETNTITVWTEKGREFLHNLLKQAKTA